MARPPSNGRRRLPRAAAGSVALALSTSLLAGCGGGDKARGSSGAEPSTAPPSTYAAIALPRDRPQRPACGLVTQAEVEAALAAKVTAPKETAQEGRSLCSFSLATAADQSVLLVSTSSSGVPAAFGAARSSAASPQSVRAGEEAFVSGPQALVRKGTTMVAILVTVRQQPATATASVTKLAEAVGARL